MSDWGACVDLPACISAGMDVEMPDSGGNHFPDIMNAVKTGSLPEEALEAAVERIEALNASYRQNSISDQKSKTVSEETRKANHDLARRVEEESAVLLKNDAFLPLSGEKELLIVGDLAVTPRIQGGGSSHIHTERIDSLIEQFEQYQVKIEFTRGYKSTTFQRDKRLEREALDKVREAKDRHIPVLFFGGLTDIAEGEGYDRESFDLPLNQAVLLAQLLEANDRIGFISVSGSPYDMELPSRCKALLQLYLGGEAAATACARIVLGIVNPSGKLAETIPYRETDVPSYGYFGTQKEQSRHLDDVEYRESIFVGYRYYDTFHVPVRYCFGYGLSYTDFVYSDLRVTEMENRNYRVTFSVENIGAAAGSEIAELYVRNPEGNAFRAKRELRGFAKVRLEPGEKKEVAILLDSKAFSVYQESEFRVIGGTYELQVGASLQDIRLSEQIEVTGEALKCPLTMESPVPLSEKNFHSIYTYRRTHLSDTRPGEFTAKNSLVQLQVYSRLARMWIRIGKIAVRLMYFPKSVKDPEVRMMLGGIMEGNIDSVCNQSGGILKKKTIMKIINSANRGKKHE